MDSSQAVRARAATDVTYAALRKAAYRSHPVRRVRRVRREDLEATREAQDNLTRARGPARRRGPAGTKTPHPCPRPKGRLPTTC